MPALGKREKGDKAKRKHHFPSSSKQVVSTTSLKFSCEGEFACFQIEIGNEIPKIGIPQRNEDKQFFTNLLL